MALSVYSSTPVNAHLDDWFNTDKDMGGFETIPTMIRMYMFQTPTIESFICSRPSSGYALTLSSA